MTDAPLHWSLARLLSRLLVRLLDLGRTARRLRLTQRPLPRSSSPRCSAFLSLSPPCRCRSAPPAFRCRGLPAALGLTAGEGDAATLARDQLVLWSIRLPRIAIGGDDRRAAGRRRRDHAGPVPQSAGRSGLVGVSSGGALAAAATIVLGDQLSGTAAPRTAIRAAADRRLRRLAGRHARCSTGIATRENRTSIAIFLLGGLAIAALANAGIGLLIFVADDRQLRDITFWLLGSLGGATWAKVAIIAPFVAGDAARHAVHRARTRPAGARRGRSLPHGRRGRTAEALCIVLVSAMTGAAVSFAGVIGFVGIVVPHLLRLVIGPGPPAAAAGLGLLSARSCCWSPTPCARTLAAPAEVPIGILTAMIGAPFFLACCCGSGPGRPMTRGPRRRTRRHRCALGGARRCSTTCRCASAGRDRRPGRAQRRRQIDAAARRSPASSPRAPAPSC